jgi:hypothetical protein
MPEDTENTFRYRILRYAPNLIRDEWVNIGVLLEEVSGERRALRVIDGPAEFARVRRLHPGADVDLLAALSSEFEARFRAPLEEVVKYLETLDRTLSNALQFGPQKGVLSDDFDAEMERLYAHHVAPPPRAAGGILESTRAWMRTRLNDVFRRHRVLAKMNKRIRVDEFTHSGDPFRLDYSYQNGVQGYVHSLMLARDPAQAKVLAYTAEAIRSKLPQSEFAAITESEPLAGNPRHQFVLETLEDQSIRIVPMNRVEMFAEELRIKLQ